MIRILLILWLCSAHVLIAHDIHSDHDEHEHGVAAPFIEDTPRGWALVTGVSVIWALFSTYGWWRARRK